MISYHSVIAGRVQAPRRASDIPMEAVSSRRDVALVQGQWVPVTSK